MTGPQAPALVDFIMSPDCLVSASLTNADKARPAKQQLFHLDHRLLGVSPGTVGVEFRWKVGFEYGPRKLARAAFRRLSRCRRGLTRVVLSFIGFEGPACRKPGSLQQSWSPISSSRLAGADEDRTLSRLTIAETGWARAMRLGADAAGDTMCRVRR